ncbi:MAG TPA: hypothetical protein PLE99_00085 [Candidatus Thiothrix moscowensis]|uniref:hypothetical protein n=1 Tax=unclassified Thiothrix TaxID=2636184 RepID=UPI0025F5A1EC|nr:MULTISPECIES: hypothetical protein [unclassified Thiothrix]HRJ51135.1 hypothetical protein [Candidatus Thiothrix moscowensis]HRJ91810.1 hypothetical protein [Candidatus Thiothrix moscowensis]
MISYMELHEQNHKITELSNVLSYLINERAMCDTAVSCELFFRYLNMVREHLEVEERELYQELLVHEDNDVRNTGRKFLSGSGEIKRIFDQYRKRWCKGKELRIRDHEAFVADTRELFGLVIRRIDDETVHLYPTLLEQGCIQMEARAA